jgi:hypothetical protein
MTEPKCLAYFKADEYAGAIWVVDNIYVYGNFRAHGHGEFELVARKNTDKEWTDLESGLNYNFGRVCDQAVQEMMASPTKPLLLEIMKAWGETGIESPLDFLNFLMNALFCHFEPEYYLNDDFIKIMDSNHVDAIEDIKKDYLDLQSWAM